MADIKRVQEMSRGTQNLDGWRLRTLTEEKAHTAGVQFAQHREALKLAEGKLSKGDVAGAVEMLSAMQKKLGETINDLK